MTLRFCGFVVFPQNSFSRSLFICFIVLWKCFAFFWKNCSDSRIVVLIREELFWFGRCCFELPRRPAQKPGYPYGKRVVKREVCRRGQGKLNENKWRRQYLSARRKDIERTKQNPIALFGFTDHNSTPTQSKSCLNNVALGAS